MEKDDRGPYGTTLVLESLLSVFRFFPAIFPAALIGLLIGIPLLSLLGASEDALPPLTIWIAVLLALSPVIASVLTLNVLPGGYGLTRRALGGREPSVREREELLGALQELTETAPGGTIEPSRWLVIDAIDPNALVVGTTIYVQRGLFRTPYLLPVLAHELGHLNHGDGRLVLALRRLVPPPFSYLKFEGGGCLPLILKLCGGGFGLTLMTPAWNSYWQKRELLADRFAFECGQADALIEFLETYQFFDVAVPFHTFTSTHPYTETRIDRLQDLLEEEGDAPALDLVVLDEAHLGSSPAQQIKAEQAWIRASGRRLVNLAHAGSVKAGAVFIRWEPDSGEQYDNDNFKYVGRHYLNGVFDVLAERKLLDPDPVTFAKWDELMLTNDSERTVVVIIVGRNPKTKRYDASHYLVGMRDGGELPTYV